jgi:hypothetical protein
MVTIPGAATLRTVQQCGVLDHFNEDTYPEQLRKKYAAISAPGKVMLKASHILAENMALAIDEGMPLRSFQPRLVAACRPYGAYATNQARVCRCVGVCPSCFARRTDELYEELCQALPSTAAGFTLSYPLNPDCPDRMVPYSRRLRARYQDQIKALTHYTHGTSLVYRQARVRGNRLQVVVSVVHLSMTHSPPAPPARHGIDAAWSRMDGITREDIGDTIARLCPYDTECLNPNLPVRLLAGLCLLTGQFKRTIIRRI